MTAPTSIFRPTAAYARVRLPVERLIATLENECRDVEAQALRDLLASHRQQRISLVGYHRRLSAVTTRLMDAIAQDESA